MRKPSSRRPNETRPGSAEARAGRAGTSAPPELWTSNLPRSRPTRSEPTTTSRRGCHGCYHDIMRQLTLRVPEELAERLKGAARDHADSVNGYAVKVLSAAVDPDLAGDEITALRERLAQAGLLLTPERVPRKRPSAQALSRARAAAGRGRSLSDFVAEGRR
jgi:hypothetical protein